MGGPHILRAAAEEQHQVGGKQGGGGPLAGGGPSPLARRLVPPALRPGEVVQVPQVRGGCLPPEYEQAVHPIPHSTVRPTRHWLGLHRPIND